MRRRAAWALLVFSALMWTSAGQLEREEPGDQYPLGDAFFLLAIVLAIGLYMTRPSRRAEPEKEALQPPTTRETKL